MRSDGVVGQNMQDHSQDCGFYSVKGKTMDGLKQNATIQPFKRISLVAVVRNNQLGDYHNTADKR